MTDFTERAIQLIGQIPKGYVATYGQLARLIGNPRASRQIANILYQYSREYKLPWQRVVNSKGNISLRKGDGYEMQKSMLLSEGIIFEDEKINLKKYLWLIE